MEAQLSYSIIVNKAKIMLCGRRHLCLDRYAIATAQSLFKHKFMLNLDIDDIGYLALASIGL